MPTTDRRARRLAIARRRARIAAQPRAGDVVIGRDGNEWRVAEVSSDLVWCDLMPDKFRLTQAMAAVFGLCIIRIRGSSTREQWRELVRRARRTQEGSAQ